MAGMGSEEKRASQQLWQILNLPSRAPNYGDSFRLPERDRDPTSTRWRSAKRQPTKASPQPRRYCRVVEFDGSCSRQNPNASCAARSDRLNSTHSLAAVR
jgi:hypothetical protein